MSIGQRIKELRATKKISQKDLAEAIGVSRGNVGDWELDKVKPGADALIALSDFFDVSADWILRGEGEKSARISEQAIGGDFSPADIEFLAKFRRLTRENRIKVEGIIEGLLLGQGSEVRQRDRTVTSSKSVNGNEREEAAAKSEA
ncbi:helix-turn-helix domain-containing protein [Aneurinibacillus danicus]|jgi:transcriptional regulator with XRE-family HTH domain|uniref:HTH cro/C1-type domain-containing protein n=1 Tax=Aneurinibacillus danicus TaxID=267746 RepID=A0A511VB88_9BACL|nr:helix-turn-helix transcriptional regulator [Aneurinibacillus danicus]GEN36094.1 hypothetical protein ADA01nite_35540 [Aneurinibacillus danicus]